MASDIFRSLIEQKIDIFASTFGDNANKLFKSNNKLIHPLEYGMYRERCARELLSFTCDKDIGISDGFLISNKNHVSTQCDLIMYQKNTIPVIDNGISNFFPIEVVKGIGEIKSDLTKKEFGAALVKMAGNKQMFEERSRTGKDKMILEEKDEIFSFLICNKLNFDWKNLDFDQIYQSIENRKLRHNMILSLQDGLILYKIDFNKTSSISRECFKEIVDQVKPIVWFYPHHTVMDETFYCDPEFMDIDYADKYRHIIYFLHGIQNIMFLQNEYKLDIGSYLTNDAIELRN